MKLKQQDPFIDTKENREALLEVWSHQAMRIETFFDQLKDFNFIQVIQDIAILKSRDKEREADFNQSMKDARESRRHIQSRLDQHEKKLDSLDSKLGMIGELSNKIEQLKSEITEPLRILSESKTVGRFLRTTGVFIIGFASVTASITAIYIVLRKIAYFLGR